jgi:hypothetical protein
MAVCSEIHTKHSTQSQHHVELLNVKPGGTQTNKQTNKLLGFKRINEIATTKT